MSSVRRTQAVARLRQVAMYLAKHTFAENVGLLRRLLTS
jgi:chromosomal replication initiation ATPase DnaA